MLSAAPAEKNSDSKLFHSRSQENYVLYAAARVLPSCQLRSNIAQMNDEDGFSRERYESAAAKYRPRKTRVLFVAEAPPSSIDRYFYFEDVKRQDALWVELMKAVFGTENWTTTKHERKRKRDWLLKFQENGYSLLTPLRRPWTVPIRPELKGSVRTCAN